MSTGSARPRGSKDTWHSSTLYHVPAHLWLLSPDRLPAHRQELGRFPPGPRALSTLLKAPAPCSLKSGHQGRRAGRGSLCLHLLMFSGWNCGCDRQTFPPPVFRLLPRQTGTPLDVRPGKMVCVCVYVCACARALVCVRARMRLCKCLRTRVRLCKCVHSDPSGWCYPCPLCPGASEEGVCLPHPVTPLPSQAGGRSWRQQVGGVTGQPLGVPQPSRAKERVNDAQGNRPQLPPGPSLCSAVAWGAAESRAKGTHSPHPGFWGGVSHCAEGKYHFPSGPGE